MESIIVLQQHDTFMYPDKYMGQFAFVFSYCVRHSNANTQVEELLVLTCNFRLSALNSIICVALM